MIGAIIAGGSSSRFGGEPKGLVRVGGVRIIDRIVEALRGVAADIVLISNASVAGAWVPGVAVVADARPERGSLVGIHTALSLGRGDVMVVAWDMPFVTPALLQLIVARGRHEPFATVPESAHGLEPFCALYTAACISVLETALDDGDLRMSSVLQHLPSMTRIPSDEIATVGDPARLFFNVNDSRDLAVAERLASGG